MSEVERLRDGGEAEERRGRLRDVDEDGGLGGGVETGEDAEPRGRWGGGGEAAGWLGRLAAVKLKTCGRKPQKPKKNQKIRFFFGFLTVKTPKPSGGVEVSNFPVWRWSWSA